MKRGRLQCKDIPNDVVIQAIAATEEKSTYGSWRVWPNVLARFDLLMPDVPRPLLFAKVDRMVGAGQVHACVHRPYNGSQCRGDIHLPEECKGC